LIAVADKPQTADEIKRNISPRLKQHLESNLKQLIDVKILKATENDYRFANPEAKILTHLYFKENPSA
jgi:FKBP-type peptidyl-prolyl cis-trans isomerase (trigger factor)